ncbi:hypothetical protein VTH8203_01538 [Vibrio thalassae]|uniref:Uncharacterized protein n=1 Tax=Vibrio thalassae TaxID=1243014 RepID=A0A240EI64_9VIBR|nr:hypothetical protein VTH8203_01538 [Vibrio thalassae]
MRSPDQANLDGVLPTLDTSSPSGNAPVGVELSSNLLIVMVSLLRS